MKKLVFILAVILIALPVAAEGVSKQDAALFAKTYLAAMSDDGRSPEISDISVVERDGLQSYYIIRFSPYGWALVAADDRVSPLLGYSLEGSFDEDSQPEAMTGLLSEYAECIKLAAQSERERHQGWDLQKIVTRASSGRIEPMIEVKWNQAAPYNKHCPVNTNNQRALVGCVSVALAQALSVNRQPDRPKGRNGYTDKDFGLVSVNFDSEEPYNWNAIMNGSNNYNETARLLFHCGVAVNMDYGLSASGAYGQRIPKALTSYFSYDSTAKYYSRNNYSGDWEQLILAELIAGRTVIYDGTNDKGTSAHAFNIDGFDGGSSFHINWGWGGKNNGYFTLENLNDGNFNYIKSHGAVVNIGPKGSISSTSTADDSFPAMIYRDSAGEYILKSGEDGEYSVYNLYGAVTEEGRFGIGTQQILKDARRGVFIVSLRSGGKNRVTKIIK